MQADVLCGVPITANGLNLLVPLSWWQQVLTANKPTAPLQQLQLPTLVMSDFIRDDSFDNKALLVRELEEKCSLMRISKYTYNPRPVTSTQWTAICPELWYLVEGNQPRIKTIYTYLTPGLSIHSAAFETVLVRIVFCSRANSEGFIGYLPGEAPLISTLREIGFELGFVELVNSRINLLSRLTEKAFRFHELEKYKIKDAPDLTLMAFNMEHKIDNMFQLNFDSEDSISHHNSNEAVMGDLNTMEDDSTHRLLGEPLNDRTQSTGAETPFSFAMSDGFDLDREYRVTQLFGAKQPQEVVEMRERAEQRIEHETQLTPLPSGADESFQAGLDKLAEQLLESVSKRRSHKDKQFEMLNNE